MATLLNMKLTAFTPVTRVHPLTCARELCHIGDILIAGATVQTRRHVACNCHCKIIDGISLKLSADRRLRKTDNTSGYCTLAMSIGHREAHLCSRMDYLCMKTA